MASRWVVRLAAVTTALSFATPIALAADVQKVPTTPVATEKKEAFGRLTVDEVDKLIKEKKVSVFDNNSKERYEKGHVPTATWVSVAEFDPKALPADKNRKLVFYCSNEQCMACHAGAKKAIQLGYTDVNIMPSGIMGWEKAKKPVETGGAKS